MAKSLNKVMLIGNLTRDPEMRYTPQGTAVCTFGLATNRQWKTESGETKEEAEFFRLVAWAKLAEICSQMLHKGTRVYVEGRLQTRKWTGQDGQEKTTVEIVISDMIVLTAKGSMVSEEISVPDNLGDEPEIPVEPTIIQKSVPDAGKSKKTVKEKAPKDDSEDLPF